MCIAQDRDMPGYEVFEKEAWGFKVSICSQPILYALSCVDNSMTGSTSSAVYRMLLSQRKHWPRRLGTSRPVTSLDSWSYSRYVAPSMMRSLPSSPPEFSPALLELPTIT